MADLGQIIVNRVKPLLDEANSAGYRVGYDNGFDSGYSSGEESVREYVDTQVEISKKAIIGRGGDISSDAGLEDLPNAILNIPADASLAHYTDNGIAYRKSVPVGAEKYALLKSVGGMTYKCKNLIPYPYINKSYTISGITFTDNGDGTITANGTATDQAYFILFKGVLPIGKYFLSGASQDGPQGTQIYFSNGSYSIYKVDTGSGVAIDVTKAEEFSIVINILKGTVVNNAVFKPMLNEGTALPYEPYYEGLRDSKVTEIVSYGSNREPIPKPIPKALQDIDGWGWGISEDCYNYADYEDEQFVKRVEKAVFNGMENYWVKFGDRQYGFLHSALATFAGSVCLADRFTFGYSEKSGSFFVGGSGVAFNTDFDTLDEWKTYLAEQYTNNTPVTMYYELAEPVITDISDILTDDNFLGVESGGSLEFVNEYKNAVPSTVKYTVKVGS